VIRQIEQQLGGLENITPRLNAPVEQPDLAIRA
jgi:hypothetical protein